MNEPSLQRTISSEHPSRDVGQSPKDRGIGTDDLFGIMQMLTRVQDLRSLYPTVGAILLERVAIQHLAIFMYHPQSRSFELVYGHGLGIPNGAAFASSDDAMISLRKRRGPLCTRSLLAGAIPDTPPGTHYLKQLDEDAAFPLTMSNGSFGLLSVGTGKDGLALSVPDTDFIQKLASQASICIANCQLHENREAEQQKLNRTLNNLSLLYRIGQAMTYISDLKSLLDYILKQAIQVSKAEKGSIMLYD